MIDYRIFDPFLNRDTWHTSHPLDDKAFFRCLRQVVEHPDFNPEAMGEHFRQMKDVDSEDHPFAEQIDDLVRKAWTVREFLQAD
jgi:hypothetical protein